MMELNEAASGWKKEELEQQLRDVGVPAGVVRTLAEVFETGSLGLDWTVENPSGLRRSKAIGYTVERFR
jgi:crotonobetainyl-CoA:carnitine CoA-transferase CaiB-like acyl-CoA transferase